MAVTREDAEKLLAGAGVSLTGPNEAAMGVSRIQLCRWLMEQWEDSAPETTILWETPLYRLYLDEEQAPEESVDEEVVSQTLESLGLPTLTGETVVPSTFGQLLTYLETRLAELWREPDAPEPQVTESFFGALRQAFDSRIPVWYREVSPGEPLAKALPASEAEASPDLQNSILRVFGVQLPLSRSLWGFADWEVMWFIFWASAIWFGWRFILPLHLALFLTWCLFSAGWLSWLLYRLSSPAWPANLTTIGDLSLHLLTEHRKVRQRIQAELLSEG